MPPLRLTRLLGRGVSRGYRHQGVFFAPSGVNLLGSTHGADLRTGSHPLLTLLAHTHLYLYIRPTDVSYRLPGAPVLHQLPFGAVAHYGCFARALGMAMLYRNLFFHGPSLSVEGRGMGNLAAAHLPVGTHDQGTGDEHSPLCYEYGGKPAYGFSFAGDAPQGSYDW